MEALVSAYTIWLNVTVPDSALFLGALRAFLAFMIGMTLWGGARLLARYPRVLTFWLAFAPLPFALVYFAAQTYYSGVQGPDATVGQIWINVSVGLSFAGYWTLLGFVRRLMRQVYG